MSYIQNVIDDVARKHANEPEFVQTVTEVLESLAPVIEQHPEYEKCALLERIVEPERQIQFRVSMGEQKCWSVLALYMHPQFLSDMASFVLWLFESRPQGTDGLEAILSFFQQSDMFPTHY